MRIASFVVLLAAVAVHAEPKPAASVAAASKGLEAARANLSAAMKRVEGDSPTAAELDAALEAVDALKDAIDAGAAQEANDLEYAKAALAARKELRERRDVVEARRAKLAIFDRRRALDGAVATMRQKVKAVEAKEPSQADFEAARAAIAEVKKGVADSKPFAPRDQGFAAFLGQLEAETAKLEKATDEKWAMVEGAKHQARVEEARQAFLAAVGPLTAESTDEQFAAVDRAAKVLGQRLDEGKALEAQDRAYGSYAAKTRSELAASKKKSDELWSKTGFTRLKAEVEPTAKDLANAVKTVHARKPTDDQLAEARTVAIIARKLLEKYDAEAQRSVEFGQYVAGVRANLLEVEAQLQLRALDGAVKDLRQALVKLEKAPSDDDFSVARSALTVLDKTLESTDEKNPLIAKQLADAKAWQREGKATIEKRRHEIDAGRQAAELEQAVKDFRQALAKVQGKAPTDDDFAVAASALTVLEKTLEPLDPKDPLLSKQVADAKAWQREGKATIEKRRHEVEAGKQAADLGGAAKELQKALGRLAKKTPSDDDFAVAQSALTVLEKTLESVDAKDPLLSKQVADAQAWQREGKRTIASRRIEVDVEAQQEKVEAARKAAGDLIGDFSKADSGEEQFKQAAAAVANITTVLDGGKELTAKDKKYAWYDKEVRKRVGDLEKRLATRRLQLDAIAARAALGDALVTVKEKLEAARAPASTDADLEAAQKAIEAADAMLEAKGQLELQAGSYAGAAEKARNELYKRLETLELARQEREARKRTVDAYALGLNAQAAAQASKDMRTQKREYERAASSFKSCRDDGARLLDSSPQFSKLAVVVDGQPSTVRDVVADCGPRYEAAAREIKPLAGLIAFEDGPKKAYELAVRLLDQGKQKEALAQFDECTATGVTLGVRNPEMKERTFTVAGRQVTLSELTTTCTAKSRELLGKK
ncbi:MAG: hypothetical protein AB1730_28025 [Myxococcota bacterium]